MKVLHTKCIMCGVNVPYWNPNDKPKICHKKVCITNYEYQKKHRDPVTGKMPSPEEIKKW